MINFLRVKPNLEQNENRERESFLSEESIANADIPEFLRRDGIYESECMYQNKIGNINKDITILGMDNLGIDVIKKVKHLGYSNIYCILLAEDIQNLESVESDGKIFINRNKNISEYYKEIDYIVDNSTTIIQIMNLGSSISTCISDRINYQCSTKGKNIAYISKSPLNFEGSLKLESANKQKDMLKNESIFIMDSNEYFNKYEGLDAIEKAFDEMTGLAIEAIDYVIQATDKCNNEDHANIMVINQNEKPNNQTSNSIADELLKYKELLDLGLITREEFDKMKSELIGKRL